MSENPRRLLLVALFYPPDNVSGAARPHRFVKYLEELGYTVDVIAGTTSVQPVSEGRVHRLRAQLDHAPKFSFIEKLFRVSVLYHEEGIVWAPGIARFARRWRGQKLVILSTSPPITTHLAAYAMKKLYGWKWIADFRDPLVGNPYRLPRLLKYDRFFEKLFFRNADALIANTDSVAERWRNTYPAMAAKIHCIWNGFDPEVPLAAAPIPASGRKFLRHVGVIYGDRFPTMLLESMERLVAAGQVDPASLCVDLVGPIGEPIPALPTAPWFQCNPQRVPRAEANRLICETDYLLLLDVTQSNTGLQVPAKIFDYIRIGRPVLACTLRNSPVDNILTQSGIPYVGLYAGDPPGEIDRRLLRFLEFPNTPVQPSEWFQQTFDGRLQAKTLASIIEGLP